MRRFVCVLTIAFSLLGASRGSAQSSHAASRSALEAAVQAQVQSVETERARVERLLARPDVRAIAERAGIDMRSVGSAVKTMDQDALQRVAGQALAAEQALAGGQSSITISTTAIIIGLLVLILLIVALN
jgi:pyruvate/2-oxoglutarate dehydrogenase complex dihydrolipoamide acyltransferase (E2) component